MRASEYQHHLRDYLTNNLFLIISILIVTLGGGLVGVLPPRMSLFLAVMLIGFFLAALTMVNKRTRSKAVVLMLVVLPLTGILKAITGSRFGPLAFDLGLFFACVLHLVGGLAEGKLRVGKLDILLFLLWMLAFVEIFNPNVPNIQAGVEGFRKFIFMSLAFYISRHLLLMQDFRLFIKGMVVVSIPVTLYGIKQFFVMWSIDYRLIDLATSSATTYLMGGWIRPFSTMPGPFHLGAYLMILLLLGLALLTRIKLRPSIRLVLIGLFILQLGLLLMTRTKGNWGGFLVGAVVLILLQSKSPLRAIVRLGGFALLGGAVIFLILTFTSGNTLTVLNDAIFAITHPLEAPTFIYRIGLWEETMIPALIKQPFIGYGTSSAGEGLLNLYEGTGSQYFNSHNLYLKIFLELGIFGLILFLWIVGESFWIGLRQLGGPANKKADSSLLLQWSIACVIAFLVSGIVIPNLDAYPVNYYFWLLLGLLSRPEILSVRI